MATPRSVPDRFVTEARASRLTPANTRRGSQRRAAVDLVHAERGQLTSSNTATVNSKPSLARRAAATA